MPSSVASSSSSIAQLLFVVVIMCITTSVVSAADINAICSKALNTPFCLEVLNSIPGAAGLDLKAIGKITINNAIANATATQNLIKSLLSKATDPQVKKNLGSCSDSFGDAVASLQESLASFASADYSSANIKASAAETDADDCNDAIGSSVPFLLTNIKNVESYCSIILVIANILGGSII